MYFDPAYFLFVGPALLLAVVAEIFVKSTFSRYAKVVSRFGATGAEAARLMLERQGVQGVTVEQVNGLLSDHYDPRSRKLRLSHDVYFSPSLSSLGVACHEAGHALQHAEGYRWLGMRTALVPVTNFGSHLGPILFFVGLLFQAPSLLMIGIVLFSLAVGFTLITLPVEWDASRRAKIAMVDAGLVTQEESRDASKVLDAAFLTYLASALTAIMTLLYYLFRAGFLGSRREE